MGGEYGRLKGAGAEEAVPFPVAVHRRSCPPTKATGRWLSSNRVWAQVPNGRQLRRLLRARRDRPRDRRVAEQLDELAPPHSITL
jgi:hypothetical protein